MNMIRKYVIEKPLDELSFKWFDGNGNQVEYGKHVPYLYEVRGEGFDYKNVVQVELPICDYTSNNKHPIVKIHCQEIIKIEDKLIVKE